MILFNFFKRELPKLEVYCRKCGKWHPRNLRKEQGQRDKPFDGFQMWEYPIPLWGSR